MSERIKPALTAEEWAKAEDAIQACMYDESAASCRENIASIQNTGHAMAAVALHGQPFGFTREDVEALRRAAAVMPDTGEPLDNKLHLLADRIEALLPPESQPAPTPDSE